ncbi:TspO/MBR family protein [Aquidulcibacter paucihalophilus]|nr:TspO/MBR family protein [Aquidulcibacter paucihalophilus]
MPEPHILAAILWALLLAGAGGALTTIGPWYRALKKPSWQPPDWLFGPAWTLILSAAAWAAVLAWEGAASPLDQRIVIGLYAANFVFHFLWSPLFFALKRPDWALAESFFLWVSVVALCVGVLPFSPLASALLVPYVLWVTFATYLNYVIVRLNGPFGTKTPPVSGGA